MRTRVDDTDRQQREVYNAEGRVSWSEFGAAENLGELEDVWEFIYRLMRRQSFARRYPKTYSRLHIEYKMKPERIHNYGRKVHVLGVVKDMDSPYRNMTAGLCISPSSSGGCANRNEISLDRWARQKWYVIHEVAHVVDYNENGTPSRLDHQGHGWQFCSIYLNLVGMAFGADAKKELRECFKNGKVRYLRPRGAKNLRPGEDPDRTWVV